MIDSRLTESLLFQTPYFGPALCAFQGVPKRHAYMQAVVELLSREEHQRPIRILEVGSWAGGSAITWAKALKKNCGDGQVVCVDQWQPYFDTKINSEPIYKMMNAAADGSVYRLFLHNIKNSGVDDIVLPIVGNSRQVLPTLQKDEFSIIYLDASHLYHDVVEDIKLSLNLVKNGGILCGDDLELQKAEVDAADLEQDVLEGKDYTRSKTRDTCYHPGVTKAVAELFGQVSSWEGFWAVRKTPEGWGEVDLSSCDIEIPEHVLTAESVSLRPVATYGGYNIVQVGEIYYGLRQSLGEVDLRYPDDLRNYSIFDVFTCATAENVKERIDNIETLANLETRVQERLSSLTLRVSAIAPESNDSPQLLKEDYRGFNLISYDSNIWAVAMAAGPVDFHDSEVRKQLLAEGRLFEAMTVDGARAAVDRLHDRQALEAQMSILKSGLEAVTSRISEHVAGVKKEINEGLESLTKRVSSIVPESDGDPRLLEENYRGFKLLACAGKVWALEMGAGPVDFVDADMLDRLLAKGQMFCAVTVDGVRAAVDRLHDRQVLEAQMSILGSGLEAVTTRISEHLAGVKKQIDDSLESLTKRVAAIAPESSEEPRILEEDYCGFKLLAYAGKEVWAVEMAAGPVDFADADVLERLLAKGQMLRAVTVDGVRAAVDRLLDRRGFEAGTSNLGSRIEERLAALDSRLEQELKVTANRTEERLAEIEIQMNQRQESLAQRVSLIAPESDGDPRLLEEDYRGFKLLAYADKVCAVEMAAGPADFADTDVLERLLAKGQLLRAVTVDGVRAAVDRLLDRRTFEAGLVDMVKRNDDRLHEMGTQLEQHLDVLAQQSEKRLVALERPWWRRLAGIGHRKNRGIK